MTDPDLIPLLLRVQQLQSDYLAQAATLAPTVAEVAAWLDRMHGMPAGTVDPDRLDPALPEQLLALPLFRHYLVNVACGPLTRFVSEQLGENEHDPFRRLKMPAHEFAHVLNQWNAVLHRLHQVAYIQQIVDLGRTKEQALAGQADTLITDAPPELAMQFMTLCALPPEHVENRKMLRIGGRPDGSGGQVIEAYPLLARTQLLRHKRQ